MTGTAMARPEPRDASLGTRLLLACGIAGPVLFWVLGAVAAATWPGYDPVSGSISVLVHAPDGWLQVDAFILLGVLSLAFAVGMGRVAGATSAARRRVRSALLVLAAIQLGFALFPTDAPGAATSLHGGIHMLVFATFAIAFPVLAWRIAGPLRADPPWRRAGTLTAGVAVGMAVAILTVVLTIGGPLEPYLGLLERAYVAVPSLWLAGIAAHGLVVTTGRFGA
jgi:hypothetical membrane protein